MKRNIFFSFFVLLCTQNGYGAASHQPAVISPELAASAIATCSFEPQKSFADPNYIYCSSSDTGKQAVCFGHKTYREIYAQAEKKGNSSGSLPRVDVPAPIASCVSINAQKMPGMLACVSTGSHSEGDKSCFDKPIFCSQPRTEFTAVHCFDSQYSRVKHELEQAEQMRLDWAHFLSLYDEYLVTCPDDKKIDDSIFGDLRTRICPLQDESLGGYVDRIFVNVIEVSAGGIQFPDARVTKQSWFEQLPWRVQRYLLAIEAEFNYIDRSIFEHIVLHKDEELLFRLWERGARPACDTLSAIKDTTLKSHDARSLVVLNLMADEGIISGNEWKTADVWAADLSPELALSKISALRTRISPVSWLSIYYMRAETPGAQAVKDWAAEQYGQLNLSWTILKRLLK